MKKIAACLVVLILAVQLSGCDPYSGRRPTDLGHARWVCEEHNIWFEIPKDYAGEAIYGEIPVRGEMIEVEVWFDFSTGISFTKERDLDESSQSMQSSLLSPQTSVFYLSGDCIFGRKKLVVNIKDDVLGILNGAETITFIRIPLDEGDKSESS